MVAEDIGYIIFVQLLQMTEYPGSPFTGDIVRDAIMFLLVPSVFIILVIYMMLGRLLHTAYVRLRLLVGVTAYLFIIAGGYYRSFALLAGPYFIFLIFVLGLLMFFIGHFRRGGPGGAPAAGGGGGAGGYPSGAGSYAAGISDEEKILRYLGWKHLPGPEKHFLEQEYKGLNRNIASLQKSAEKGARAEGLSEMMRLRDQIELKLFSSIQTEEFRKRHM